MSFILIWQVFFLQASETATEKVVKTADGNVSQDVTSNKETSELKCEDQGCQIVKFLPKILIVLILVALASYIFTVSSSVSQPFSVSGAPTDKTQIMWGPE